MLQFNLYVNGALSSVLSLCYLLYSAVTLTANICLKSFSRCILLLRVKDTTCIPLCPKAKNGNI